MGVAGSEEQNGVDFALFLNYFRTEHIKATTSNMLGTIQGIDVEAAIGMIRDKFTRRMKVRRELPFPCTPS